MACFTGVKGARECIYWSAASVYPAASMKRFDEFERRIIDQIINLDETQGFNVAPNILEFSGGTLSQGTHYIETLPTGGSVIQILSQHFTATSKAPNGAYKLKFLVEQTSKEVFVAAKLFDYLESKNLVYTYSTPPPPATTIGQQQVGAGASYIPTSPLAPEIDALVRQCLNRVFVPTPSLVALRANDYLSEEEVRFQKNMTWTRRAVIISAIAALVAAAAVFVAALKPDKADPALIARVDSINGTMETVAKELNGIDAALGKLSAEQQRKQMEALQKSTLKYPSKQ
jgi:hypothetical protein